MSSDPKIEELISFYAMISRLRAISPSAIVACAERVLVEMTGAYDVPFQALANARVISGQSQPPVRRNTNGPLRMGCISSMRAIVIEA